MTNYNQGQNKTDIWPKLSQRLVMKQRKKCRDRYKIAENNSLLLSEALTDRKSSYDQNEYCIDINYKATTRFEHFPEICQDTRIQDSRLV